MVRAPSTREAFETDHEAFVYGTRVNMQDGSYARRLSEGCLLHWTRSTSRVFLHSLVSSVRCRISTDHVATRSCCGETTSVAKPVKPASVVHVSEDIGLGKGPSRETKEPVATFVVPGVLVDTAPVKQFVIPVLVANRPGCKSCKLLPGIAAGNYHVRLER